MQKEQYLETTDKILQYSNPFSISCKNALHLNQRWNKVHTQTMNAERTNFYRGMEREREREKKKKKKKKKKKANHTGLNYKWYKKM